MITKHNLNNFTGKKETQEKLTNKKVKLNSAPICFLYCLPKVNFSKRFLFINEMFIAQLVVFQLVFGFIDLLVSKLKFAANRNKSKTFKTNPNHFIKIFINFNLKMLLFAR